MSRSHWSSLRQPAPGRVVPARRARSGEELRLRARPCLPCYEPTGGCRSCQGLNRSAPSVLGGKESAHGSVTRLTPSRSSSTVTSSSNLIVHRSFPRFVLFVVLPTVLLLFFVLPSRRFREAQSRQGGRQRRRLCLPSSSRPGLQPQSSQLSSPVHKGKHRWALEEHSHPRQNPLWSSQGPDSTFQSRRSALHSPAGGEHPPGPWSNRTFDPAQAAQRGGARVLGPGGGRQRGAPHARRSPPGPEDGGGDGEDHGQDGGERAGAQSAGRGGGQAAGPHRGQQAAPSPGPPPPLGLLLRLLLLLVLVHVSQHLRGRLRGPQEPEASEWRL